MREGGSTGNSTPARPPPRNRQLRYSNPEQENDKTAAVEVTNGPASHPFLSPAAGMLPFAQK